MENFVAQLHADPWVDKILDLPELNHEASALVESGVSRVKAQAAESLARAPSSSIVLLGPPGTGKTHLFSRLRKRLGPRALFVHVRPVLHAGLTPSFVLHEAVNQLARASYGGEESQADALVGSLIGNLEGQSGAFPVAHLSTFRELGAEEREGRLCALVDRLLESSSELDDVFLERLLRLPFVAPRTRRALLAWLSGQDCDPSQLGRIGASSAMAPDNTLRALKTLSAVAALSSPLVLVFDQLENLIQKDGREARVTQYGHLVAELVDSTRGLLVVQMALDSEWQQGILPHFNLSQRSRVVMESAAMALPDPQQSRALLELWCGELEERDGPFPWPFSGEQVEKLTQLVGVTPRVLLTALREAHGGSAPSILQSEGSASPAQLATDHTRDISEGSDLWDSLSEEWQERLVAAHLEIDRAGSARAALDVHRLCDGLLQASSFAPGAGLVGASDAYIQMDPQEAGGKWACFLHQAHHKSVGAAFERILGRDSTEPGVVLREQWRPFPPTWKSTHDKLAETIARPHTQFVELERAEAACLLALEEMLQLVRSRDLCDARGVPLEEAQVRKFLQEGVEPQKWSAVSALAAAVDPDAVPLSKDLEKTGSPSVATQSPPVTPAHERENHAATSSHGLDVILQRLHVASVDRLIREARRVDRGHSRASVLRALEQSGSRVQWFGRNIVAWGAES